jgi:hypothetical protein
MVSHAYPCNHCQKVFRRATNRNLHAQHCRHQTALNGGVRRATLHLGVRRVDYDMSRYADGITRSIMSFFRQHGALKVMLVALVLFRQVTGDVETVTDPAIAFHSKRPVIVMQEHGVRNKVLKMLRQLERNIENFQEQGSGWTFLRLMKLIVDTVVFKPLAGGTFLPTPCALAKRKAIINVKSNDNRCFEYAVLGCLYRDRLTKNPNRPGEYTMLKDLVDFSGLKWPMDVENISTFERRNPSIGVNVFAYTSGKIAPLRLGNPSVKKIVDLLLLSGKQKRHFVAITSLERLLHAQVQFFVPLYLMDSLLEAMSYNKILYACVYIMYRQVLIHSVFLPLC